MSSSSKRGNLAERIEKALKTPRNSRRSLEGVVKTTGQRFIDFPWEGSGPRPWKDGYTRVLIMLDQPTPNGKRTLTQIIHNSKLSHG